MYETFLSSVPLLSGLNTWEKAKIADALETEHFEPGEVVIKQGDVGEYFYLVESGEAEVIVEGKGVVRQYQRGDYFGGTYRSVLENNLLDVGLTCRTGVVERCAESCYGQGTDESEGCKIG